MSNGYGATPRRGAGEVAVECRVAVGNLFVLFAVIGLPLTSARAGPHG